MQYQTDYNELLRLNSKDRKIELRNRFDLYKKKLLNEVHLHRHCKRSL
jgi:hypothetical protein